MQWSPGMPRRHDDRDATDKALDGLLDAARKLAPEQGIVARRNARKGMLDELRKVRKKLDAEYPPIRTKASQSRARLTPGRKIARLHKRGYQRGWVDDPAAQAAVRIGVKLEACPQTGKGNTGSGRRWYPTWLYDLQRAGVADADLKRAHRSTSTRRRLHAAALLTMKDDDDDQ